MPAAGTSSSALAPPAAVSQPLWPHGTVPKEPVQRAVPVTALPRALLRALLHLPQGTAVAKHLGTSRLCKMSVPAPSFKRGHAHDALEAAVLLGCLLVLCRMGMQLHRAPPAQGTVPGTSPAPGQLLQSGTDVWVSAQLPRHLVNREMG